MNEALTFNLLIDWAGKLGTPGVFAFCVVVFWRWAKPHLEKLVPICFDLLRGHINLMSALERALGDQSSKLEQVVDVQGKHTETLREIREHVAS